MKQDDLDATRWQVFSTPDNVLYVHVGYFALWFSKAELALTHILARVCEISDLEAFAFLVRGMDARVKIERLKSICNRRLPMPKSFEDRINHFETIVTTRNRVAHSALSLSADGKERLQFSTVNQMPYEDLGLSKGGDKPHEMPLIEFFEQAYWLHLFATDLLDLQVRLLTSRSLEITDPHSWVPKEHHPTPTRRERRANTRKHGKERPK